MSLSRGDEPGSRDAGVWLLLAPYLVGLLVLFVIPGAATLGLAAFDYDLVRPPVFAGLDNFAELAADPVFAIVVRNTVAFVAVAVPMRLLAATALALTLHRSALRGGRLYRLAIFLPSVVPEVALAIAWLWILNPLFGPLNGMLAALGLGPVAWLTDPGATQAAIVLMSLLTIGEAFVIALAARRAIPSELHDMAVVDGGSPFAVVRSVTLPLMLPVLLLAALRDVVLAVQATYVPSLVVTDGGPPPYATTYGPLFVYEQAFEYLRYGHAAAATAIFVGLSCVVVALQLGVLRRWRRWAWA